MRTTTYVVATTVAACLIASCSDQPTAPNGSRAPSAPELRRGPVARNTLLTNIPVSGPLSDGGSFTGTLSVTHIAVDPVTRALSVTGTLSGMATNVANVITQLTNVAVSVPATLVRGASAIGVIHQASNTTTRAVCDVLLLDLGPLHLDLLGLTVDLSQVILDVNAVSGAGNLVGNLLCGLLSILDLPGVIADITHLVDNINSMLDGLGGMGVGGAAWIAPLGRDDTIGWMQS
jgi:hypothetical protein